MVQSVSIEIEVKMKSEIYKGIHFHEDEFGDAHLFCCELLENFIDGGGEVKYGEVVSKINIKNGLIWKQ